MDGNLCHNRRVNNKHLVSVPCTVLLLLDFSLTVKAATLIFITGCGSVISYAKRGKSGFIYNSVKSS